jgi:sugar transferase EpsL
MNAKGWYSAWGKRAVDLVIATTALIVLAPVLIALTVVIGVSMGWPVVFRQERPGLHGQPFTMIKFRTMTDRRDHSGALLPDGERLTPLGSWLRRTSLDELPELLNVIVGQMSLVGPRPLLMEYLPLYSAEQARRHEVRPGITGWAQVHGRNELSWQAKFSLDSWYVDHVSPGVDVQVLRLTFGATLSGRDVSRSGHATAPKFTGNSDGDSATGADARA